MFSKKFLVYNQFCFSLKLFFLCFFFDRIDFFFCFFISNWFFFVLTPIPSFCSQSLEIKLRRLHSHTTAEEKSIPKIFCHWLLTPAIYNRANNKAGQASSTRSEIESHWPKTRYFYFGGCRWTGSHVSPWHAEQIEPLNGMTRTFIARHFSSPSLLRKKTAQLRNFLILFICFPPIFFFPSCYRSLNTASERNEEEEELIELSRGKKTAEKIE